MKREIIIAFLLGITGWMGANITEAKAFSASATEMQIVEVDSQGYTLQCKVAADETIATVKFPVWTLKADSSGNQQDDILWGIATRYGNYWRYRVKISAHNNEYGVYRTHIYAENAAGTLASAGRFSDVQVNKEMMPHIIEKYDGKLVSVYDEHLVYSNMTSFVKAAGSELISIKTEAKDLWIKNLLGANTRYYYYTGGYRETSDSEWKWGDGSIVTYTNWHPGEPNNNGNYGDELFIAITTSNGMWNDIGVDDVYSHGFIIETPLDLKPVMTKAFNGKIYKVYNENLPYNLAKRFCEENGGNLVQINTVEENNVIAGMIRGLRSTKFFIGATDIEQEGTFVWSDGTSLSYQNFKTSEPDNGVNETTSVGYQNYITISEDGTWMDDLGQSATCGFIAEFEAPNSGDDIDMDDTNQDDTNPDDTTNKDDANKNDVNSSNTSTGNTNTGGANTGGANISGGSQNSQSLQTPPASTTIALKKGTIFTKGKLKYKVTKLKGKTGEVAVQGPKSKNSKSLTIPAKIKKNGITLKVTSIAKKAFYKCEKLKKITIRSKTIKKIGKKALRGVHKKLKVSVPKSKLKKYSKLIKKAK